jgi:hypothetical protein
MEVGSLCLEDRDIAEDIVWAFFAYICTYLRQPGEGCLTTFIRLPAMMLLAIYRQ